MNDKPSVNELLEAAYQHLETQVAPVLHDDRKLYYQTLVAINVLKIIQRELQHGNEHLKEEWTRLNFVQNLTTPYPDDADEVLPALSERNRKLCEEIDAGRYDYMPARAALFEHLLVTTRKQLEVANPRYLEALAEEDKLAPKP